MALYSGNYFVYSGIYFVTLCTKCVPEFISDTLKDK